MSGMSIVLAMFRDGVPPSDQASTCVEGGSYMMSIFLVAVTGSPVSGDTQTLCLGISLINFIPFVRFNHACRRLPLGSANTADVSGARAFVLRYDSSAACSCPGGMLYQMVFPS